MCSQLDTFVVAAGRGCTDSGTKAGEQSDGAEAACALTPGGCAPQGPRRCTPHRHAGPHDSRMSSVLLLADHACRFIKLTCVYFDTSVKTSAQLCFQDIDSNMG